MRRLSIIAVVGLLIGIGAGVVGQYYGLAPAEIVVALVGGGLLAMAVHRPQGRRSR